MGAVVKQRTFEAIPTGTYPAVIGSATLEDGKYGQQVKIRFDLVGDLAGRSVFGWAGASFGGKSKLTQWARAALFNGSEVPPDYDLDLDHFLDRRVMVVLLERSGDDGTMFNRVEGLKSMQGIGGQPPPPGAGRTLAQHRPITPDSVRGLAEPSRPAVADLASSANEPPDWPGWGGDDDDDEPRAFPSMTAAVSWGQAEAWGEGPAGFTEARAAYEACKAKHKPATAQAMWDAWIAEVKARKAAMAAEAERKRLALADDLPF